MTHKDSLISIMREFYGKTFWFRSILKLKRWIKKKKHVKNAKDMYR